MDADASISTPSGDGGRPLASSRELAEYVGVPLQTVYKWRAEGSGPRSFKVGRYTRYRWSDIEEWLNRRVSAESA